MITRSRLSHTHRAPVRTALVVLALCWGAMAFAASPSEPSFEQQLASLTARRGRDADRFQRLLRVHWQHQLDDLPETATALGVPGHNTRWNDQSPGAIERRKREPDLVLKALRSINRARLTDWDRLSYDVLQREQEEDRDAARFPAELMPIHRMGGLHSDVPLALSLMPRARAEDYRDVIRRLGGLPRLVDQTIALMRMGTNAGVTPPRAAMTGVAEQLRRLNPVDPSQSPLLEAFRDFPDKVAGGERDQLRAAAAAAFTNDVRPALERLRRFIVEDYEPACRETAGLSALPGGAEWYATLMRRYANTSLSPREIHELGRREVARIHGEMELVRQKAGFAGDFPAFADFLRTDPRFFHRTREDLLASYRDLAKRVDPELPRLFGRLPRLPYGIRAVPEYAEAIRPTAYYIPGSLAAGRAGCFYANTGNLVARPRWEMEALLLHEAVPGHHLQIALTQEIENLPDFRRRGRHTAFVEGWALYAESLGEPMGCYADPFLKFGQLSFAWWRAARLVVDTGIHAFGWSRQQAIDFLRRDSAQPLAEIEAEVDRYIAWPGQALAYKLGELRFAELRTLAEQELGDRFDLRRFHDAVLGAGPMPLDMLEARMRAWVSEQKHQR